MRMKFKQTPHRYAGDGAFDIALDTAEPRMNGSRDDLLQDA